MEGESGCRLQDTGYRVQGAGCKAGGWRLEAGER